MTKSLNEFLGTADGVNAIIRESVTCVVRAVVNRTSRLCTRKSKSKNWRKPKAELGGDTRAAASQTMRVDENGKRLGSAPIVAIYIDQTQQQFQRLL